MSASKTTAAATAAADAAPAADASPAADAHRTTIPCRASAWRTSAPVATLRAAPRLIVRPAP